MLHSDVVAIYLRLMKQSIYRLLTNKNIKLFIFQKCSQACFTCIIEIKMITI